MALPTLPLKLAGKDRVASRMAKMGLRLVRRFIAVGKKIETSGVAVSCKATVTLTWTAAG